MNDNTPPKDGLKAVETKLSALSAVIEECDSLKEQSAGPLLQRLAQQVFEFAVSMRDISQTLAYDLYTPKQVIRVAHATVHVDGLDDLLKPAGREDGHVLYKDGDADAPVAIKDRNGDIALAQCRNCGKAEVELDGSFCTAAPANDSKPSPQSTKAEDQAEQGTTKTSVVKRCAALLRQEQAAQPEPVVSDKASDQDIRWSFDIGCRVKYTAHNMPFDDGVMTVKDRRIMLGQQEYFCEYLDDPEISGWYPRSTLSACLNRSCDKSESTDADRVGNLSRLDAAERTLATVIDEVPLGILCRLMHVQDTCYGLAEKAGWWKDLETGEDVRTWPEKHLDNWVSAKLMLIVTEIAEAMEGHRKGLMDDKLPHRMMLEVELADAIIRIMDLAGGLNFDVGGAIVEKLAYNLTRADHKLENRKKVGGKSV